MKYILCGLLAVILVSGCAKNNPVAPALDTGAANSGNANPPTSDTSTHQTNAGNGNGKISFTATYQSQPLKNTTIILTTLNGSTVNVTTDNTGKAYISGLNDGTYSAALQSSPGMNNPIQTKTTTISSGSSQTITWQDAKQVSISPLDYNYSGYSPASGCTESTSPATYSDPRYYQFGSLAETRTFKLYYDDAGDFQGPATVSVSVDGNCTYTFTPSSTGDELGTLTYNIPAFNQNPILNISITATCYGSNIFVKNYSLTKDWALTLSGTSVIRSGRINTDSLTVTADVPSSSCGGLTTTFYPPPYFNQNPTVSNNITGYSNYAAYYLSGSSGTVAQSCWSGNTLPAGNIYAVGAAVSSPSMAYVNTISGKTSVLKSNYGNSATYWPYTQTYNIHAHFGPTDIIVYSGTVGGIYVH